ncbi:MAG: GlsB/YeaQ/YmgE family stress response membrane protein, partial [Xanthomonadaceae bacterium]|nr:GlsB/YeaQ/YmgE family stress response membrane protein [Xanthomonadaceae bacterium]
GYLYPGHGMMTWVVAILGAIVLLFLFEMIRKKK